MVAALSESNARAGSGASSQRAGTKTAAMRDFATAWATLSQYSTTVTLFERKGAQTQRAVYDYTFQKPASVTLHVVSGASAGDTLVWDGGDTVVAHRGSGLLSVIKKKLSLHDPLTTTIRGSSIDELSFGAILAHAQDTSGALVSGAGGAGTETITLVPKNVTIDGGYTREVVAISKTSHLPMRVFGYDGRSLVREIDFSNVKLQPSR